MTPDEMAECAAGGRYWYMRADGTFYGVGPEEGPNPGPIDPADMYLLDGPAEWRDQWESWEQAVDEMAPLFAALNEFRN